MASAFADRANRTGREVGIYDFLRKSNESLQIPHLNVFGDKGNTCHAAQRVQHSNACHQTEAE